ncbi:MAG: pirin family protein [Lunatimonas sp.]|uniref:pirin family protein n=1 Tax=Lunatimonas sp. TaxID=2060141 RepID=UPI00263B1E13|nr:pirin family protein [Lunatimonas sp.]MCC5935854.1 pirin family protein [Lunatimonas sp.]
MTSIKTIRQLGSQWVTQDPFLFCAYHHDIFPRGDGNMAPKASLEGRLIGRDFHGKDGWNMYHGSRVPGFPSHPHKGFETVTIVEKGLVDHSDSLGAAGRFGEGDVQWMTAGRGVMHSEMFPLLKEDDANELLLFQIWLNLPQKSKQVPAHFKMMWNESIPIKTMRDESGKATHVKLISGQLDGLRGPDPAPDSWAADPANDVQIWHIHMEAGAQFDLPKSSAGVNRTLFFYAGDSIAVEGKRIPERHSLDMDPAGALTIQNGNQEGHFIFLQGKPLNEKVVQHGPFVMNSNEEIQQAVYEFQRTQFGGWPWPSDEHTHPKERGRFAIHADGREEVK